MYPARLRILIRGFFLVVIFNFPVRGMMIGRRRNVLVPFPGVGGGVGGMGWESVMMRMT